MRLLLIEDHKELAELTASGLSRAGYSVDTAASVSAAEDAIAGVSYDAIILDPGLPDGDGYSILKTIRRHSDSTPVLILTARRSVNDRVKGLESGADDCLTKPFALSELTARIKALLRRPSQFIGKPIVVGNIAFDTAGRQLFVDGKPHPLSARATALFELLIRRMGRVVPKEMAESQLFGQSDEVRSNAIEVYVHRLRKQLSDIGGEVEIRTIRGVGYLMLSKSLSISNTQM